MRWQTILLAIISDSSVGLSSDNGSCGLSAQLQSLVENLAASSTGDVPVDKAKLWRRLGKIQLDAGEYAEARQIFCHGSTCCPSDEGLRHHVRVWDTFHAANEHVSTDTKTNSAVPPPLEISSDPDLFLSFDVPVESIPKSVKKWKGQMPSSERRRLIHASKKPILPREACQFLIDSALQSVKEHGWTTDRHVQAPTCDIPVFDLPPEAQIWCRQAFHSVLFPLLAEAVGPELEISAGELRVQDCFIVRYDATEGPGFSSLRPHEDESLLSLTIALNDMTEYEGGGLFISSTGDLLNGDAGTVLCFAGGLVHGGYPMSRGTRWILTVFLYVDSNESGKIPGYTLRALEAKLKDSTEQKL